MTDDRAVAHYEAPQGGAPAVQDNRFSQTIQMVREAMLNPTVDAEKAKVMAELMTSLEDRSVKAEFNRDKNAAIMEMPVITKEGLIVIRDNDGRVKRTQGRFAKWEDIDRIVRPILARHNLALSFDVAERQSGGVLVAPILTHANGYTERGGAMPIPADTSGSKNAAQAIGSAVAYGKRYTGCGMLNIVTEGVDDDGSGAAQMVNLPYERQELVLCDARLSHEAGHYHEWFSTRATPKDRAWLVATGHHAEFGGKALPAPVAPEPVAPNRPKAATPPPPPPPSPPTERRRASPREWTDGFKEAVTTHRDTDSLDLFVDEKRELLARLKTSNEELWNECDKAIRDQREAIEEGRLV